MKPGIRQHQLTLLGELPAARLTIYLHTNDGVIDRNWWIEGLDDDENRILLWSDRTGQGPRGGLNMADLLASLLEISRLLRIPSQVPD